MHPKIAEKASLYKKLISRRKVDKNGFICTDRCDSLLFTGLASVDPSINPRIYAAYDKDTGLWHRRPLSAGSCWPGGSKSTISRDMILGLAWYCFAARDPEPLETVIRYALRNWLFIGKADNWKVKFGRCFLTPNLLATLAQVSYYLGGPNRWWLRWIPADFGMRVNKGFKAHLQVLHILLRTAASSKEDFPPAYKRILRKQHERQPQNALFALAAGDQEAAEKTLLDDSLFPPDRLPTSQDRGEEWLWQRDVSEWAPERGGHAEEYTGADLLFVKELLSKRK